MYMPMPNSTMLARNATRQPHALGPASVEAAPTFGRVLHRHQDRSTVLAADPYALQDTQRHQQDRRPEPDAAVRRQESYEEGRGPHYEQREDQHGFATDLVPVVAEDNTAHGPGDEA